MTSILKHKARVSENLAFCEAKIDTCEKYVEITGTRDTVAGFASTLEQCRYSYASSPITQD